MRRMIIQEILIQKTSGPGWTAAQPEPLPRTMRAFLIKPHALQLLGEHASTRQNYPDFGELTGLRVHLNRPAMLLDDDVVADG